MQENRARQRQIVVHLTVGDQRRQSDRIPEQVRPRSKTGRHDAEQEQHVDQIPTVYLFKARKKYDPEDEIEGVVEHHSKHLRQE